MILIIYQNSFFCVPYVHFLHFAETTGFTCYPSYYFLQFIRLIISYNFHSIGRLLKLCEEINDCHKEG